MSKTYDAIVIGTGPAGGIAARALNKAGLETAVADHRPFGGTCPLRGCEPKKVMVDLADTVTRFLGQEGHGLSGDVRIDWRDLMSFKESFTEPVPGSVEESFEKSGVDTYHGKARFTGERSVAVGDDELEAEKIVIAAGAVPRELGIPGEEHILLSNEFLNLKELPERIVFIGGGYISFEFAYVAAVAGAKPLILHRSGQPLKGFDHEIANMLVDGLCTRGLEVVTDAPVTAVEKTNGGYKVHAGGKQYEAGLVVHGAGRVPATADLDLQAAGIKTGGGGVSVNEFMQSVSNPAVYAAGDVVEVGQPLTPVANMEAEIAVHNILNGNERKADYTGVPSALFTCPPLASVGMSEAWAKKSGVKYERFFGKSDDWSEHQRLGETGTGYKVLYDPSCGCILGAHILGHNSTEIVNVFGMAMRLGKTIDDLKDMVWSYPSYIYTIRYMIM
jgi:glutathione reductase (NADPH)